MRFRLAVLIVALMGFISLSYEIVWYRTYSFVSGSAPAVFGLLLAAFLLGLALGAFTSRVFCSNRNASQATSQLPLVAGFVAGSNAVAFLVVPALSATSTRAHWAFSFPLVTVAAALFGATFPIVSHFAIRPDQRVGARVSYLYLANILGSAGGSLITGFVLMNALSLEAIALSLALLGVALAAGLLILERSVQPLPATTLAALIAMGAAIAWEAPQAYAKIYEKLLYKQHYSPDRRFQDIVETRSGVVAVSPHRAVFGNGAYDGMISTSIRDDRNGIVRAYAIPALHPSPRRVLMIGLATGAWAHVLAQMPGVDTVTIVEINPGYIRLIAKYPEVSGLLRNPRARIIIDDGRRWLARHPAETFDVIVANTTWHWRAHTTNLLSREYLQLVRRHLRQGGIYYFNTTSSNDAYFTAFTVFPYGVRFRNFAGVSDTPIHVDGERWRSLLSQCTLDGRPILDLTQPEDRAHLEKIVAAVNSLAARTPDHDGFETRESVLARIQEARSITDDNMAPEWHRIFEDVWLPLDER
jgi:spermidine synthase